MYKYVLIAALALSGCAPLRSAAERAGDAARVNAPALVNHILENPTPVGIGLSLAEYLTSIGVAVFGVGTLGVVRHKRKKKKAAAAAAKAP